MAGKTEFEEFLAETLRRDEGVVVPVKASRLERAFARKAATAKLHPNPEDEFCDPAVGPNLEIISRYVQMIRRGGAVTGDPWGEPLIVQKVRPDGYMLLNGHHRWAAALKTGYTPVRISVVNLTQEQDIKHMIKSSKHDRRVTLDLDELAFCPGDGVPAEKPLPFPLNRFYRERLRLGIPALLHFLGEQGYDIWVYTSKYYSIEYIRAYFRYYTVKVDGIITGAGRKRSQHQNEIAKQTEKLINSRYIETLHIDRDLVLRTRRDARIFEEYPVEAKPEDWSLAVMEIVKRLKREGAENESVL